MELVPTIDSLRWLADAGPGILEDERIALPVFLKQKRARFTYEPLGVVGVIAPWNYPWSIPFGEVAVALMAGNGVVLKPASLTPLIGQRIQEVFERAGLPEGLVRTVHGGGAVGQRARGVHGGQDLLHRLGRGRPRGGRGVRPADEGLGARARRQGPDDRLRRREPVRTRSRGASGAASRTPARPARASSASTSCATWRIASSRAWSRAPASCASAIRWTGTPRSGRWSRREQLGLVTELVDDAVANGATLHCGGRASRAGFFRARRAHGRDPRDAHHARGDLRTGRADRDRGGRGRGDRPRQRLGVRPRRVRLDDEPPKGERIARRLQAGHGVGQRPHVQPRGLLLLLGRSQGLRASAARTRSSACTSA